MKFQFQFAGVNLDRPVPQHQRRKRWLIFGASLTLVSLCYWQYLRYLSHGSFFFIQIRKPVPVASAKPVAAKTAAPVAHEATPEPVHQSVESAAATALTQMAEAVKPVAPAAPVTEAAPASPANIAPITVSVVGSPMAVLPRIQRPKPIETPEQRLQRAGQTAMETMLNLATKSPDAYGFLAEDVFTETRLGAAIPIYTISEKDRAAYQSGQPVEDLLKPANQWVFPIYAGSRLCCMVQVSYNGHEYIPGGATRYLAMAWTKIAERWPENEGYRPRLVVNPDISGYYFTVPEAATPNMTDTLQMFHLKPHLSPADVILTSWR